MKDKMVDFIDDPFNDTVQGTQAFEIVRRVLGVFSDLFL